MAGTVEAVDRRAAVAVLSNEGHFVTELSEAAGRKSDTSGKAALDVAYGRALGVRYVDRVKVAGNLVYRLTALAADGTPAETVTSNEVNPMRRTPGPERPSGLRAEVRPEGVALFWEEPPGGNDAPVVAYRVARGSPPGRSPALTRKPVVPSPHPRMGEPKS